MNKSSFPFIFINPKYVTYFCYLNLKEVIKRIRREREGREMEREGGREGRGRRGKMGKGRGGIIVGGIALLLVLGCNNGVVEELEKKNENILSISNLRKGFLDAFVSFGDLLKESFGITKDTTKQKVGEELGKVGDAVKEVKGKLESLKGQEQFKLITNKAGEVITNAINTLDKIVKGTNKIKEATDGASKNIASSNADGESATPANGKSVQGLVEGIGMLYGASKEAGIEPKGNASKPVTYSQAVGNLFGVTGSANAAALKAAHMVFKFIYLK